MMNFMRKAKKEVPSPSPPALLTASPSAAEKKKKLSSSNETAQAHAAGRYEEGTDDDSAAEGGRMGRRVRGDRKQFKNPTERIAPVAPVVPDPEAYWTPELDNMWIETSLLLRVPIRSAEDLIFVEASAEAGLLFMSELDEVAKNLSTLRGTLSRWLLPYDQNTRLDEQSSTPHRYTSRSYKRITNTPTFIRFSL